MRTRTRNILSPALSVAYAVIVLEFLFMISPLALHFYSSYAPVLNALRSSRLTAWSTRFFLPHFSITGSPVLDSLKSVAFPLVAVGLVLFVASAVPVYVSKLRRSGVVTGGLYRWIRHPQYVAFAVVGLGTTMIWPRGLVLLGFVSMLFAYGWLARDEERRCEARFGDEYRRYLATTGRFVPRVWATMIPRMPDRLRPTSAVAWVTSWVLALAVAAVLAGAARSWSLSHVASVYTDDVAVLSPAPLSQEELLMARDIALADPQVRERLVTWRGEKILVHVVPAEWYLPDLPLPIDEIVPGHSTPGDFDRTDLLVLVSRPRTHASEASGRAIVLRADGMDPVAVARVDLVRSRVVSVGTPPGQVLWGDIPAPLF